MTSVLKAEITSVINGLLTITVRSVTEVEAVFNQLLIIMHTLEWPNLSHIYLLLSFPI